jgi:penicillin-binding protein 2
MTDFQIRLRSYLFRGMVLIAFMVLATQLWNLQVVQGENYKALADANRFRLNQVPAARGVIYDRAGRQVARNVPAFTVSIRPADLPRQAQERAASDPVPRIFASTIQVLRAAEHQATSSLVISGWPRCAPHWPNWRI